MGDINVDATTVKAFGEGLMVGVIGTLGVFFFFLLVFMYLYIKYPYNISIIVGQIWKLLTNIFGVFAEKQYIKNDIEGKVGIGINSINSCIDNLDSDDFKIKFVKNANREAFVKNRMLVMRIKRSESHGENLANVAFAYSEHLYSKIEPSFNTLQRKAVSLYTAKSILQASGGEGVQDLNNDYFLPTLEQHHNVRPVLEDLETIDRRGLFYSVFIQEMVFLGNKVSFRPRVPGLHQEVSNFLQFLVDFASRQRGDETVEKNYTSNNIRVAFVLVAKPENRELGATENYTRYVEALPRTTESFYFMGWGENINFVRDVAKSATVSTSWLDLKREKTYVRCFEDGICVDAVCALARNRNIAPLQVD